APLAGEPGEVAPALAAQPRLGSEPASLEFELVGREALEAHVFLALADRKSGRAALDDKSVHAPQTRVRIRGGENQDRLGFLGQRHEAFGAVEHEAAVAMLCD